MNRKPKRKKFQNEKRRNSNPYPTVPCTLLPTFSACASVGSFSRGSSKSTCSNETDWFTKTYNAIGFSKSNSHMVGPISNRGGMNTYEASAQETRLSGVNISYRRVRAAAMNDRQRGQYVMVNRKQHDMVSDWHDKKRTINYGRESIVTLVNRMSERPCIASHVWRQILLLTITVTHTETIL